MKKIIVFCVAFLATMSLWASETYVKNADGVKIWYDFDNESTTASVTYKGFGSSEDYDEYTGEVVIPSTVTYGGEEYSVTSIGNSAFEGCTFLTSVTIPEGVTEIGNSAFEDCNSLPSITLPESVTTIGVNAFYGCSSLTSITIPESVTWIGDWAFEFCRSLTSIDVAPNNENYASIDGVLFSKDKTILIKYPEGKDATSYTIPESVTTIGVDAFYGCSDLISVTIPDGVTSIGDAAFLECLSLTSVTIPESVTEIGDAAFADCGSLTSITLPESVTSIGDAAFFACTGFTSITCKNTTPPTLIEIEGENHTFDGVDKSIPLYVPAESVEAYNNTKYWKDFTNIQAIPSSSVANAKAETQDSVRKEYRDGQVLIIKGDKTYTMFGTEY